MKSPFAGQFRWRIRKIDGAWHVYDAAGELRHATGDWVMAMTYADMGRNDIPDYRPGIMRAMRRSLRPPIKDDDQ